MLQISVRISTSSFVMQFLPMWHPPRNPSWWLKSMTKWIVKVVRCLGSFWKTLKLPMLVWHGQYAGLLESGGCHVPRLS